MAKICSEIGQRLSNEELRSKLSGKWVRSASRICEQIAEMSGCLIVTDRTGFVKFDRIGPRGPIFARTNPPGQTADCPEGGASKLCDTECQTT